MPSDREAGEIYESEYTVGESFNDYYAGLSDVRKSEAVIRLRSLSKLTIGRTLLDVGAGLGLYVEAAIEQGWDAEGVEIAETALAIQQEKGLPVIHSSYENYESEKQYDVITLWAVLEHVIDPRLVLEKTHELLKPGGIVVIETGDISSKNAVKDGERWRMFYIAGHLYFFSGDCLDRILGQIGFDVIETRLDKWVEHTLMQNDLQRSILHANNFLPAWFVRLSSALKSTINLGMGSLGYGDVLIKIARKKIPEKS